MSEADLGKWDARYRDGSYATRTHPTKLLEERLAELPRGRALDVACGAGRNALYLAAAGYEVDAVDISSVGLERARAQASAQKLAVRFIEADLDEGLEAALGPTGAYDLIVMVRYVDMPLVAELAGRLRSGGHLLVEQHLRTAREVAGPQNPAYRLRANELLHAAAALRIVFYREGVVVDPDGRIVELAQLVGVHETHD